MSTTVKANVGILEYAVELFNSSLGELKGVADNLLFSLTFEPLPVALLERSAARGGNAFGLQPEDGPLVVLLLYTSWDRPGDDEKVFGVNKKALEAINLEAEKRKVAASFRYLNYACPPQDPIASFGAESNARLREVSAKYDTGAFFFKRRVWDRSSCRNRECLLQATFRDVELFIS